ncbi:MAG: alpha-L-rhamnosidase N-terminal domain-containing protein, partial [Clostridiales bacterium]|nr:alpha-L-rhamnosidase N-terminal domain-containing protein [Clostridiales bacterium]
MNITDLKVNGIREPMGLSCEKLSFSWKVRSTEAKRQSYAKVEVSDNPDFSEILAVREGTDLSCAGTTIAVGINPRKTYYWRVTVTGDNGETAVSETASFESGKISEPWTAQWIAAKREDAFHPVFEKRFAADGEVSQARLYICGLGLYETYINGEKTGKEYLTPYINDYSESYQYQTFDVTEMIKKENKIEIYLGKGWYMGIFGLQMKDCLFGDRMQVIA